jgi:hypothetical protein
MAAFFYPQISADFWDFLEIVFSVSRRLKSIANQSKNNLINLRESA